MLTMAEKINVIRREFSEMDINHDEYLSQDEFYRAMDKKVSHFYFTLNEAARKVYLHLAGEKNFKQTFWNLKA